VPNRSTSAAELCTLADVAAVVRGDVAPEHVIAVLTAAALARAAGASPAAVREGLLGAGVLFG
jgi:UDP-N-acetylmuramoylalanine--D-glutamate ligase